MKLLLVPFIRIVLFPFSSPGVPSEFPRTRLVPGSACLRRRRARVFRCFFDRAQSFRFGFFVPVDLVPRAMRSLTAPSLLHPRSVRDSPFKPSSQVFLPVSRGFFSHVVPPNLFFFEKTELVGHSLVTVSPPSPRFSPQRILFFPRVLPVPTPRRPPRVRFFFLFQSCSTSSLLSSFPPRSFFVFC